MQVVKTKSYAKVNLTLEITGVEGGYHLLDSCVCSIDLFDALTLKKRKDGLSSVTMRGLGSENIPPEKNNALKAAEAFSKTFQTPGADITVYKNIPIGAGLGGSSADVVGVLNAMAQLYGVTDRAKLKTLADSLGSDTGYMLTGGFARMRGRGDLVTPLKTNTTLHFLLLCPKTEVSAGRCYQTYDTLPRTLEWRESFSDGCARALADNDKNAIGRYLMNDLYVPALHLNEDVRIAYEELKSFSPLGVTMTGSGSCVLALFETPELCEWAKSRYRGKYRAIVTKTVVPEGRTGAFDWKNPFALGDGK